MVFIINSIARRAKTTPIERSIRTAFALICSIKEVPASNSATRTYQVVSIMPAIIAITKRSRVLISELMK